MADRTYIQQIVASVNEVTSRCGPIFIYGENIDYGSRIGGLARGLTVNAGGCVRNVGNCELTHVGLGLGIMLDGGQAALFGKQLDFMLLGIEPACDTFNFIRAFRPRETWGSFTIFVVVCDQGYQGPQSSLNAAGDFASLLNVPVYCLNGAADAGSVIRDHFAAPGFRFICLSQRLFGSPELSLAPEWAAQDATAFRYRSGDAATIASFNFSLRDALALDDTLRASGFGSDVFHVNFVPGMPLDALIASASRTRNLIVVDDSKTVSKFGDALIARVAAENLGVRFLSLCRRGCPDEGYGVSEDRFVPDHAAALDFVRAHRAPRLTAS